LDEEEKAKIKARKARIRKARTAQRKLKKARADLEALGEITDWEDEFIASVDERLDKYGSAFADPTKGGFGEALSSRQKQVLAQMRRKIKDKGKQAPHHGSREDPAKPKWRSSFKPKSGFKPNVRHIEDEIFEDADTPPPKSKPRLRIIDGGKK